MMDVENGGTHKGDEQMRSDPMTGRIIEANFEADTLTFEMDRGYYAAAGKYVIFRESDYLSEAEQRAELLEALRMAESRLRRLSEFDCGCSPCRSSCRTGRGAEIEFEARMEAAAEYADETLKAIATATQQRNATGGEG